MGSYGYRSLRYQHEDPGSFAESRRLMGLLSVRERQVAVLISTGLSTREIAGRLYISSGTADDHIQSIYMKWGIRSRVELARVVFAFNARLGPAAISETIDLPWENAQEPSREAPEKIEDLVGYAREPDPLTAKSLAELEERLRDLWAWAGYPSSRTLASRSAGAFSHATISKLIYEKPGRPALKLSYVLGFVRACGGNPDEQKRWATAWRNIAVESRLLSPRPVGQIPEPADPAEAGRPAVLPGLCAAVPYGPGERSPDCQVQ